MLLLNRQQYKLLSPIALVIGCFLILHLVSGTNAGNGTKGSRCSSSRDCDENRFLNCFDNVCNCNHGRPGPVWLEWVPENLISCNNRPNATCPRQLEPLEYPRLVWDDIRNKCVSIAGEKCNSTVFGWTPQKIGNRSLLECIKNARCINLSCVCDHNYALTPDGKCKLSHGQNCSSTSNENPCNEFDHLNCRNGKCECEYHGQMEYDHTTKKCRTKVGESCDPESDISVNGLADFKNRSSHCPSKRLPMLGNCVKNAFCKQRLPNCKGNCTCLEGFLPSPSKTECIKPKLTYGRSCLQKMDCDTSRFLVCILHGNGTRSCDCENNEMFFDGLRCRVHPGRNCTKNKDCSFDSYCDGNFCVCRLGGIVNGTRCVLNVGKQKPVSGKGNPTGYNLLPTTPRTTFVRSVVRTETLSSKKPFHPCSNFTTGTEPWKKCNCESRGEHLQWTHVNYNDVFDLGKSQSARCRSKLFGPCSKIDDCASGLTCKCRKKKCECVAYYLQISGVDSVWRKTPNCTWGIAVAVILLYYWIG